MYFLYSILLSMAAVVMLPWFLVQGLRHGKYLAAARARLGAANARGAAPEAGGAAVIWLHAVSVGELLACQSLIAEINHRFPGHLLLVSTTTETGYQAASERIASGAMAAGGVFFCPYDFAFAVRRVLRRLRPALLVVAETELWPHLFREAARAGVPLAVVNARISDRSFPRYRRARFFFRRVLLHARLLIAQSAEDARRLREMGADPAIVAVSGNLKYETRTVSPLPLWLDSLVHLWTAEADGVLVAGSTAEGEEPGLFLAFSELARTRRLRLIVAPRRPERFDAVERLARDYGLSVVRRTSLSAGDGPAAADTSVLLLDTVGELAAFYRYATVAFVGGSFVPHGGQNPLEPAQFARAIVCGPHMENFREITRALLAAGGLRQLASAAEIVPALRGLLDDPAGRERLGAAAAAVVEANRGAAARTVEALAALLPLSPAEPVPIALESNMRGAP